MRAHCREQRKKHPGHQKGHAPAFEVQTGGQGFGFIEVLAACPTNWRMDPVSANVRVDAEMIPYFPLGTFKDVDQGGAC